MISGSYSLAMQAVHLGFLPAPDHPPHLGEGHGQIYMPEINWALMVACVTAVAMFRDVEGLAAAYGVAVMGTMMITSLLFCPWRGALWKWSIGRRAGFGAVSWRSTSLPARLPAEDPQGRLVPAVVWPSS